MLMLLHCMILCCITGKGKSTYPPTEHPCFMRQASSAHTFPHREFDICSYRGYDIKVTASRKSFLNSFVMPSSLIP